MKDLLSRPDLREAARWFESACAYSREHDRLAAGCLRRFGDHGPLISGCVREHFPAAYKDKLRALARSVSEHSDKAWAAKPPRVRRATLRALARAVAKRDGSGFYGPQP